MLLCYTGNGTGWTKIPVKADTHWENALSDLPLNRTTHWILESEFDKTLGAITLDQPPNGLRIAMYDASNPEAGVQSWPPDSNVNITDEWGVIPTFSQDPIPEGLTFAVMALLTTVSILVGYKYFVKRKETKT